MFDVNSITIPPDALEKQDVLFWDVDFIPVVDLMDDQYGVVALDEPVRLFPCEEAYLKGIELTREQFLQRFPQVAKQFERHTVPA
ncbi:MAG: hypothetical protein WAT67_12485 [Candidatus Contendobacter sp.]